MDDTKMDEWMLAVSRFGPQVLLPQSLNATLTAHTSVVRCVKVKRHTPYAFGWRGVLVLVLVLGDNADTVGECARCE